MQRLACTCQQDLLAEFTFNILLSRSTADISMSHSYHNNETNAVAYFKIEISHCTVQQSIKNRATYTLPDTLLLTPHLLGFDLLLLSDPCCHVVCTKFSPYHKMLQRKSKLVRPVNIFPILSCQIVVSLCELQHRFVVVS